jgi:hypothetical protein
LTGSHKIAKDISAERLGAFVAEVGFVWPRTDRESLL